MKFFYKNNNCLIYFRKQFTTNFWDQHWFEFFKKNQKNLYKLDKKSFVVKITSRYLKPSHGPILEGGCGLGFYVQQLLLLNFDIVGIDNAIDTIRIAKENNPQLKIEFGDVKHIKYANDFFAGYWSLGVIEHFFEGYIEIIKEMKRVIKPNGFVFITFPHMSPMRKFKSRVNMYRIIDDNSISNNKIQKCFYQFALDKDQVINDFQKLGFNLIYQEPQSGLKGLKDEIFFLKFFFKKFLQLLYDIDKTKFLKFIKGFIDLAFSNYCGHGILLVFKNMK